MDWAKRETGQSSVLAHLTLRPDLEHRARSTFVALGEGRQRNMREEGFELLMEEAMELYSGEQAFQIKHICQKSSQSKGGGDWAVIEEFRPK